MHKPQMLAENLSHLGVSIPWFGPLTWLSAVLEHGVRKEQREDRELQKEPKNH
jgi:hypothetical protein